MKRKPAGMSLVWDFALERNIAGATSRERKLVILMVAGVVLTAGVGVYQGWLVAAQALTVVLIAAGLSLLHLEIRRSQVANRRMLQQTFALQHLSQLGFKYPLTFGRWSVSPDLAEVLMTLMLERRPKVVLELGSGTSTLVLAYCRKIIGDCQVTSVDHEVRFAERTRSMLARHGVTEGVNVYHVPLKPTMVQINGRRAVFQWYDLLELVTKLPPIDLLIVDGPPGKMQALSRYPALPVLANYLSPNAVVVLDDGDRVEETDIAQLWKEMNPDLDLSYVSTFDGAWILMKGGNEWVA